MTAKKTVWRFALPIQDRVVLQMPVGAEMLSVGPPRIGSALDLWAIVSPDNPRTGRCFAIVGTGNPLPDEPHAYIGTTSSHGAALIWHVFDLG